LDSLLALYEGEHPKIGLIPDIEVVFIFIVNIKTTSFGGGNV